MDRFAKLAKRLKSQGNKFKQRIDPSLSRMQSGLDRTKNIIHDAWDERDKTLELAKAVGLSAAKGSKRFSTGTFGNFVPESKLEELRKDVENQGGYYRELLNSQRTKGRYTDSFSLGGDFYILHHMHADFPPEIEAAYEAAYPLESKLFTLREKIDQLDSKQMDGLVSGIKGRLFEEKYVQYLNDGNLPDGYTAFLAKSTVQPGWDISVTGPDNQVSELIQAKATDSVHYVQRAIERYPEIDVVTTEEVYAQLTMLGISDGLMDSGISNADLTATVINAIGPGDIAMDYSPPLITLALIAFTSYKDSSLNAFSKAQSAGDRSGKAYLAYLLGGGVATITNVWWLGIAATVASRYMADPGQKKWELLCELRRLKKYNQVAIERLKFA